jgi:pyruvate carboxylase subunit B
MSPYAYRTSHAAIEPLVMALLGTNRDTGFDIKLLAQINEIFEKEVMPKYKHLLDDSKMSIIDINVLLHQTPGGMLSNLVNQLRDMDALDKIGEVYKELPRVRKDLGQIPLVTPTSQIVGIQTVNNVLFDTPEERYKMITGQVKDLCYGLYGKTAVPINPRCRKKRSRATNAARSPSPAGRPKYSNRSWRRPRKRSATWPWTWTTWCSMPFTRSPARSSCSGSTARKKPGSRSNPSPWMK